MKRLVFIFVALFAVSVSAQQSSNGVGPKKSDSYVIKMHGPKNPKINGKYAEYQIGDSTKKKFDPSIVLTGWDNEVRFKMNLDCFPGNMNRFVESANGEDFIRMVGSGWEYEAGLNDGGNFEWSLILDNPPPTNEVTLTYESENLLFYRQDTAGYPPEWEASIADSMLYGYVLKHAKKSQIFIRSNGHIDDYGIGNAFHIFRPKVWDSAGDTVWGRIDIDTTAKEMTIGADAGWLAAATYPVTFDPVFGHAGTPAIQLNLLADSYGDQVNTYTASTGDVITLIEAYMRLTAAGSETCDLGVYTLSSSDMHNGSRVAGPAQVTVDVTVIAWLATGALSAGMSNGVEHGGAAGNPTSTIRIGADNGPGSGISADNSAVLNATWNETSQPNATLGIRVTYTEAGAADDISYVRRIKEGEGK